MNKQLKEEIRYKNAKENVGCFPQKCKSCVFFLPSGFYGDNIKEARYFLCCPVCNRDKKRFIVSPNGCCKFWQERSKNKMVTGKNGSAYGSGFCDVCGFSKGFLTWEDGLKICGDCRQNPDEAKVTLLKQIIQMEAEIETEWTDFVTRHNKEKEILQKMKRMIAKGKGG